MENEGYLIVDTIANGLGREEWSDDFRDFYKPEKWLNSRRAACAFITDRVATLTQKPAYGGGEVTDLEKLAADLAKAIYPHYMDSTQKDKVESALNAFANEIIRRSVEP